MSELSIVKKGTCPTLSGKSKLSYVIGRDDKEVFIRIASNTGGGFYSGEWVAVKDIEAAVQVTPDEVTSISLFRLFKGKSVNTPGYLLAALKHEGVVQTVKGKKRKHTYVYIGRLTDLSKASTTKKTPVKKKASPRKRATR